MENQDINGDLVGYLRPGFVVVLLLINGVVPNA